MTWVKIPLTKGKVALVDEADAATVGQLKWCASKHGRTYYAARGVRVGGRKSTRRLHRVLLCAKPGQQVDHINGNGLDNRRCNLRLVSVAQNQRNQTKKKRRATSQYRGVYWDRGKWRARIEVAGRLLNLGRFDDEEEAARAYDEAGFARDPKHFTPNFPAR